MNQKLESASEKTISIEKQFDTVENDLKQRISDSLHKNALLQSKIDSLETLVKINEEDTSAVERI